MQFHRFQNKNPFTTTEPSRSPEPITTSLAQGGASRERAGRPLRAPGEDGVRSGGRAGVGQKRNKRWRSGGGVGVESFLGRLRGLAVVDVFFVGKIGGSLRCVRLKRGDALAE